MAPQEVKFHEVRGASIRLSDNRTLAENTGEEPRCRLCFTDRSLAPGERLIMSFDRDQPGYITFGVMQNSPSTLRGKLPESMSFGYDPETGIRGGESVSHAEDSDGKFAVYFEASCGRLMFQHADAEPEVVVAGIATTEPLYFVFQLLFRGQKLRLREVLPPSGQLGHLDIRIFRKRRLTQATFARAKWSTVTVHPHLAVNDCSPAHVNNFVFVKTRLKPDCVLIVELVKLNKPDPIEIVLTAERAETVSDSALWSLREMTHSHVMKCENAKTGNVLAIEIARNGLVSSRLSGGVPIERMGVDANLDYHVVFSMANISTLSLVGIVAAADCAGEHVAAVPTSPSLLECTVCLENPRAVALVPCYHFALCETCVQHLHSFPEGHRCPVCRAVTTGVQKIYL